MEILSTSEMTPYFTIKKCNKLFIREGSEPLSRVFNGQPRDIIKVMSDLTCVSNTHVHIRMSV